MKFFNRYILFIVSLGLVLVLSYFFAFWQIKNVFIILASILFLFVWIYPDKIILGFLHAKEINQTDNELVFQILKNIIFRRNIKMPKVYAINDHQCENFLLISRSEKTLLLNNDKYLEKIINKEKLEELIIDESKNWNLITKGLGIIILIVFICNTISKLFSLGHYTLRTILLYLCLWLSLPVIFLVLKIILEQSQFDVFIKKFVEYGINNLSEFYVLKKDTTDELIKKIYAQITQILRMEIHS